MATASSPAMRRLATILRAVAPDGIAPPFFAQDVAASAGEYSPQRILVTGGAGFLGSSVLVHMVKKYPSVTFVSFDNLSEGSNAANLAPVEGAPNLVFIRGTVTSESIIRSVMAQHKIDTVMHFAAQTHVDRAFSRPMEQVETNVVGTVVMLKVARELGVKRFLHISADDVYGASNGAMAESAHLKPGNPLSGSKAGAECLVHAFIDSFKMPIIVVRPSNIFGPRQYPEKVVPKFILRLAKKQTLPLHGGGTARRNFLYIDDAVEAFDLVLRKGVIGEVYNIGAPASNMKSVKDVASALLPQFGIDASQAGKHLEAVEDRVSNDAGYEIDCKKIAALGWSAKVSFDDGLKRTVQWYMANQSHWGSVEDALKAHNGGSGPAVVKSGPLAGNMEGAADKVWYAPYKFQAYGEDEIQAVVESLRDGWLAPGPRTEEFERRVSEYFGKKCGVMVNSGSSANIIGLASLGMQPGDEVVTPACTFSTVISPLEYLGLKPVFVDVEIGRYVPTVDAVLAAITPKTKCILLPNLIGSKPDWAELRRRVPKGIWLFEDSCDTMTHTPETDIAAISFYASHVITAGGLGGCIMFNDEKLKAKALMFRDWGRIGNNTEDVSERFAHSVDGIEFDFKFLYGVLGFNMKACEMNAAFGLAQMKKLDKFQAIRRQNIRRYVETLAAAKTRYVLPAKYDEMDWLALPLMHPDRRGVLRYLEANDVQIRVTFSGNITRHQAYRKYLQVFPASDQIMAEGFLIGAHHGITSADIDRVCKLLIEFDKHGGAPKVAGGKGAGGKEYDSQHLDF